MALPIRSCNAKTLEVAPARLAIPPPSIARALRHRPKERRTIYGPDCTQIKIRSSVSYLLTPTRPLRSAVRCSLPTVHPAPMGLFVSHPLTPTHHSSTPVCGRPSSVYCQLFTHHPPPPSALCYAFPAPFSLPPILPSVSDLFPALDLKKSIHFDQKGVFLKKRV
jgi:hypothetical protein